MMKRWVTAAAVMACLAACGSGTPVHGHHRVAAGNGQVAADRTGTGQVVTYRGYGGTAIVSADGRTVTVGRFVAPCFGTTKPTAVETATWVELWLRDTVPAKHGVCNVMMG
jgi:hypothetical protein